MLLRLLHQVFLTNQESVQEVGFQFGKYNPILSQDFPYQTGLLASFAQAYPAKFQGLKPGSRLLLNVTEE